MSTHIRQKSPRKSGNQGARIRRKNDLIARLAVVLLLLGLLCAIGFVVVLILAY